MCPSLASVSTLFPLKAKRNHGAGRGARSSLVQGKGSAEQEFFTLSHCLHQHLFESFRRLSLSDFTGRYGVLVQRAGKSDRLFDLSCGFRAKHFSNGENHSCMEFLAKDFNCPKLVASFKMMNYQAIFKNGINARLLAKLFQQAIVMFRRNVDEYFHGIRASNPVNSASH
jgi:hypothetical protein